MPRPKRARRAPAQAAKSKAKSPTPDIEASDSDAPKQVQSPERGRRRTTRSMGPRVSAADEQAIRAANQRRDAALDRLIDEDPTSSGRTLDDAESGSSIEIGRRGIATPAQRRDTTGLDLADDDVFGDLDDSFEDGDVPRGLQSADNSSLTLSNFKRRSRQSSFIGRNDPQIRPSSRGGNTPSISSTLHLGNFRRRAREPSILGTARKPLQGESGTGQEDNSESEDEFMPEAESTPLNNRRRTQTAPDIEDERQDSSEVEAAPEPTKSRKRKSEDATLSSDRPEKVSRIEDDKADEEGADESHQEEEAVDESDTSSLSSISSPLGPPPVLPDRPVTPFDDEEVMAPPASSDSEDNGNIWPDIHTLAKRRRRLSFTTPLKAGGPEDLSDMSSPPSLTHSPNYAHNKAPATRGRAATRRQASPEITTADLTNMLPRRRYRPRGGSFGESEGEYDTTEMPQGEDELSYVDSRAARRRQGSRPPSRATSARPASRGGRAAHSALKPRQIPASIQSAARSGQTYSRRSSDKENEDEDEADDNEESRFEPLPDDTFDTGASQSGETTSADELKRASKKFREVDRWELDFEEVTQSSSPSGAR